MEEREIERWRLVIETLQGFVNEQKPLINVLREMLALQQDIFQRLDSIERRLAGRENLS